jgi:tetraacyldisaccharide 4'-kinase
MHQRYRQLWEPGDASGLGYRVLSTLLAPAEAAYRLGVLARSWAYDRGLLKSVASPIPSLAIGNLTVGGTGKTPLTAWFASRLQSLGRKPAIVLRGYGGDEVEVHRVLNPAVSVHAAANRLAGVRWVQQEGADVAVLDDAYQHRRLRADAYVVLVAAEDWVSKPRLLPRGPWREPLAGLKRATLVVITRKVASAETSGEVAECLAELEPAIPRARAYIGLAGLARYDRASRRLEPPVPAAGFHCALAIAGVAKPETVWPQLAEAGVKWDRYQAFSDHHRYNARQITEIAGAASEGPLVATLKDAVKLGAALAPEVEIYVPLQQVIWEAGVEDIECLLANLSGSSLSEKATSG